MFSGLGEEKKMSTEKDYYKKILDSVEATGGNKLSFATKEELVVWFKSYSERPRPDGRLHILTELLQRC